MISRFDHAVIAVRDLDAAIARFRHLGFDVHPGGRHTGLGTYNAIIRFGLDYLELLSVADREEAIAGGTSGQTLVALFDQRDGGLVGYALATSDIEADAERFRQTGLEAVGPFPMERLRPDGRLLSWRLLVPSGVSWLRPWPFLIQWDIPDDERLTWERPGNHPNGTTGVVGISIAVTDLERGLHLYERQLGLAVQAQDEVPELAARRARFQLGEFAIDLLAPTGDGPVQQALEQDGEHPFEVVLQVRDLDETRRYLEQSGVALEPAPAWSGLLIAPDQAFGARLTLVPARS
ncbi:VOC family protein [Thermomicrobiaceae bacterium CFH 74404]|uniref:VOC family protein n=1 Tax=Thermalbibacter longus TaxID=2951981 RepID=A0AA41W9C4_9BACT|nr:VOC family protein [Thermalbibacter longus]MCM8747994.1 VOC family protein [Thermalbibacter longus]